MSRSLSRSELILNYISGRHSRFKGLALTRQIKSALDYTPNRATSSLTFQIGMLSGVILWIEDILGSLSLGWRDSWATLEMFTRMRSVP